MGFRFVVYQSKLHPSSNLVGIVSGATNTHVAPCLVSGVPVTELYDLIEDWDDVKSLITEGEPREALSDVQIMPPLAGRDVLGVAKNFRDPPKPGSTANIASALEAPMMFTKRASSIIPTGATICVHPDATKSVDYEGEMAIIIGRSGRNIKREDAWNHIWGATILNDVTARDLQKTHKQFYIGKSLDTFCPIGPFAVHASQLDWDSMVVETRVNGEIRQSQKANDLIFDIPTLVETCSKGITLQAGDIIATGTPAGIAAQMNPPPWLKPGDTVSVSVTGLGTLTNPVSAPDPNAPFCKPVRTRGNRLLGGSSSSMSSAPGYITLASGKSISYESRGPTSPPSNKDAKKFPTIVFIHGLGVTSAGFFPLIEGSGISRLHRVITFDADGHGRSPVSKPFNPMAEASRKETQIEAYAEDVRDLLLKLDIVDPVVLVGHSMGGMISIKFAAQYPNLVRKLVLFAPANSTPPYDIQTLVTRAQKVYQANSIDSFVPFLTNASLSRKTRSDPVLGPFASTIVRGAYSSCSPQGYARASFALANAVSPFPFDKINEHNIPTLLIVGDQDKFTPREKDAACIERGLKRCEIKVLKDVGHWPFLEALEESSKLLKSFVHPTASPRL